MLTHSDFIRNEYIVLATRPEQTRGEMGGNKGKREVKKKNNNKKDDFAPGIMLSLLRPFHLISSTAVDGKSIRWDVNIKNVILIFSCVRSWRVTLGKRRKKTCCCHILCWVCLTLRKKSKEKRARAHSVIEQAASNNYVNTFLPSPFNSASSFDESASNSRSYSVGLLKGV